MRRSDAKPICASASPLSLLAAPELLASEAAATAGTPAGLPPLILVTEGAAAYADRVAEMRAIIDEHPAVSVIQAELWECHMASLSVSPETMADALAAVVQAQQALTRVAPTSKRSAGGSGKHAGHLDVKRSDRISGVVIRRCSGYHR